MLEEYKNRQKVAYKILNNILNTGKYSHAYLFETRGSNDGVNMALAFAKTILLANDKSKNINKTYFPELKIINPDGMWIKKEQLDELQKEFSKKAIMGNKKIYIINNAEKLNQYASNSILKFLEEPEDNIIAILVTDNIFQLLDTIISRCQIISLVNRNKETIDQTLENQTLLRLSSLLLNQEEEKQKFLEKGNDIVEKVVQFVDTIESRGVNTILHINSLWHETINDRQKNYIAFEIMTLYYKDIINKYYNRSIEIFVDYEKEIEKIINRTKINKIYKHLEITLEQKKGINKNINLNLLLDKFIIEIAKNN